MPRPCCPNARARGQRLLWTPDMQHNRAGGAEFPIVAWYKALDQHLDVNTSNLCSTFRSMSGRYGSVTQATDTNKPEVKYNHEIRGNVLAFDGVNDSMAGNLAYSTTGRASILIAFTGRFTSTPASYNLAFSLDSSRGKSIGINSGNVLVGLNNASAGNSFSVGTGSNGLPDDLMHVFCWEYNSSLENRLYIDGTPYTATASGDDGAQNMSFRLGITTTGASTYYGAVEIHEVVMAMRSLLKYDVRLPNVVMGYLAWAANLQGKLDPRTGFRNSPPLIGA